MQAIRQHPSEVPFRNNSPPPYLFSGSEEDPDAPDSPRPARAVQRRGEELPYRVEVWSEDRSGVEQTLAMTANGSIGYAAYYEATREYPGRYVVLRHKNRIVARWNAPDS
jgi:hypothetical protein